MTAPHPQRRLLRAAVGIALVAAPAGAGEISGVQTDKARYDPTESAALSLRLATPPAPGEQLRVQYMHLGDVVGEQTIDVRSQDVDWSWRPPSDDYRGYLARAQLLRGGQVVDQASIGIDVSSDWSRFPRYGFLSNFDYRTDWQMDQVIQKLNRYHINGLQFYDWANKHHDPLAGTAGAADGTWKNIANQTNYMGTVRGYIDRAHNHNMLAMSYNLANGALAGAEADGVSSDWYLYKDQNATQPDRHDLPDDWQSDITLLDPANAAWQNYIGAQTADAYREFAFDGSHVDQLGPRGTVYTKAGYELDLGWSYGQFINAMQRNVPGRVVFNAVGQYGQEHIANTGVDFLYTEVWDAHRSYDDLGRIIRANETMSGGLSTVLAAYVNYDRGKTQGEFNPASVLLADAVIFANGGSHIEFGEHMLSNEYFPSNNLSMPDSLTRQVTGYYDFLVAYQNLLRDGGTFGDNPLRSSDVAITPGAAVGAVQAINKRVGELEVFHLINFTGAAHTDWRDTDGTQPEPVEVHDLELSFFSYKPIARIWVASPDGDAGVPADVAFNRDADGMVRLDLPSLKYWSMLVAEPAPMTGSDDASHAVYTDGWNAGTNGGSGFGAWTFASRSSAPGGAGFWRPDGSVLAGIDNAGAASRAGGEAWASFANAGDGVDRATAFRTFDRPLQTAGDLFSITLEHDEVAGEVGIALRNGNRSDRSEDYDADFRMIFSFLAGESNYRLTDAGGTLDTGIGWTPFGLKIEMTLRDAGLYDLLVWRFDEANDLSPDVFTFFGRTLAHDGPIESMALFQFDGSSTRQGDVLFNHLYYNAATVPEPGAMLIGLGIGGLLLRRRR